MQSGPAHPDANHNRGVLAISVNQGEVALPLLKTALEVNPMIEQFWVSYVGALVRANNVRGAKQAIKKAKKKGFDAAKLARLLSQTEGTLDTKEPSLARLNTMLDCYQSGGLSKAEKLAIAMTGEFPKHQFAWKVLGVIDGQTDRKAEAVNANQTAVALSPQDSEAHSNLGNTLRELGRFEKAEASYTRAIALEPGVAEALFNRGYSLFDKGRYESALSDADA